MLSRCALKGRIRMFKITFMCEDNRLAKALHNLVGIAAEPPHVQPLGNAMNGKDGVGNKVPGNNLPEIVRNLLTRDKIKAVSLDDLRAIITPLGYQASSTHGTINQLVKERFLKRT